MFGKVFWDYSKIPFNLGGRINLLYCFFWGIAAVVWIKGIYPVMSAWIEKIPMNFGKSSDMASPDIFLRGHGGLRAGPCAKQ